MGQRCWWRAVIAGAGLLLAGSLPAAMDIRVYDEARHDRFYTGLNPDDTLRDAGDWSSVGQIGSTWATMVSPTFFLSANHWHSSSGSVMFYDDAGLGHSYTIAGGQQILDSDLWLGWLSAPIPAADGIASAAVYDDLGAGFIGYEVIAFGQDNPQGVGEQRLGRNVIDGVGTLASLFGGADASQQLMVFSYEPAAVSAVGGDEMRFVGGDSGGPTFVMIGGDPFLAGINYFIYSVGDRLDPAQDDDAGSGVTSVSAYIAAINAAMASRGTLERLTVVPEPGMAGLALVALVAAVAHRPRRRPARAA